MDIKINNNLDEELKKVDELIKKLDEAESKAIQLQFITIKDLSKMTGWSVTTCQRLFNSKNFPSCDFGKEKKAEISAVKNFFSVKRSESEE